MRVQDKNMNKLLTIIVPSYNMEKYLEKDLNSLVLPSDLMKKIEVIVVNDGSGDRTSDIAHEFEKSYNESVKVIDKDNGNYGSCINAGLKKSSGTFVKILDADDYFNTENLSQFVTELEKSEIRDEKVDVFFTDYHTVDENGNLIKGYKQEMPNNRAIAITDSDCVFFEKIQHHCIAYRRSILVDNLYHQSEKIPYTDQEWITIPLLYVNVIKYVPIDLYQYLLGRTGQTMDKKVISKSAKAHIDIGERMINVWNNTNSNSHHLNKNIVKYRLVKYYEYIYKLFLIQNSCDESRQLIKSADDKLKKESAEIYNELGKVKFSRKVPIKYIKYWRNNENSSIVMILRKLHQLME